MNILSTDVGSFPPRVDVKILDGGAYHMGLLPTFPYKSPMTEIFKREVISSFIDKLSCGIDVPTYPQFRDMNKMFIDIISNHKQTIPEVDIIKENLSVIKDKTKLNKIFIRVCITGPYTLSSESKDKVFMIPKLTDALCKILENSLFKNDSGEVRQVCIDEPTFGFLNDPFLDYGSLGREALRLSWEKICKVVSSKGIDAGIHLHNTSDNLFWEVEHLRNIESHVFDSIYTLKSTKKHLEETDKFLKVSVAITKFDDLIVNKVGEDKLADSWEDINSGRVNPNKFFESKAIMKKRLSKVIAQFGAERIPFFGPECGFKGFPSYECALDDLRIISKI
jgi:5-methyltetrahydropteroyltriglutamate--homocysteine methyltransferase